MPIYAYKCGSCGHAKDVLQKVSDAPLTACPACGAEAFAKQITAAGFQLKGSGWYATDFRNGGSTSKPTEAAADGKAADKPADKPSESKPADGASSPSTKTDAPSASAGGCGSACACH
ncbi:FmdB family zinc ribbon protein [Ramlibacter sp. Leaf400]|uniref:FmdB family zinc ribbon protein n=1 Tax=Ramlibacter sp. Leaf400 TaxID=1736365 RepID=UPI0006FCA3E3|nr:FmdB family zinc ribbon protein [Ramlibacter sp. Leaf400]KQT09641.1 FmdB family transcriptional regulator [Ramlibacter sp. Leaf400]